MEKIHIIGGGPAGLYLAVYLKQHNIPFILFEQADNLTSVGFGIFIQDSAFECLSKIGIQDADIHYSSSKLFNVVLESGETLESIPIHDRPFYSVSRQNIISLLKSKLDTSDVVTGKMLVSVSKHKKNFKLSFSDNTVIYTPHVVGADGIKSITRERLFIKNAFRTVYSACYAWLNTHSTIIRSIPTKNSESLIIPTEEGDVLYICTKNTLPVGKETSEDILEKLLKQSGLSGEKNLENINKQKNILITLVRRTRNFRFVKKNCGLIGDAAHGETPMLGWGTTIALEDAYALGFYIKTSPNFNSALKKYFTNRKKRVELLHKLTTFEENILGLQPTLLGLLRLQLLKIIKPFTPFIFNIIRHNFKKVYSYKLPE